MESASHPHLLTIVRSASSPIPYRSMPPNAASEMASEAATGHQEAARRSPQGREKAARWPTDDPSMAGRRPLKSAIRQPGSRRKISRRPPFGGFIFIVIQRLLQLVAKFFATVTAMEICVIALLCMPNLL